VKVGDLVRHTWSELGVGLVVGWYDSVNNYVIVRWPNVENPCHVSKLEIINEAA
tara:strand:+ start:6706 stop:6867 length:162 start_codon:yes stop_codon:yes gene_type:complete